MTSKVRAAAVGALFALESSCARPDLVRMNVNRPIETEHGYQQDGHDLDSDDMIQKLKHERASSPAIERAQVLGVVAMILAGAGGGLVGWPLGEKAGGNPNPHWGLAYAGAGALVLSIPVVAFEIGSVDSAVAAHNHQFGAP